MKKIIVGSALVALLVAACGGGGGGGGSDDPDPGGGGNTPSPYGLDQRVTASGLTIPTTPPGGGSGGTIGAVRPFPSLSQPGATSLVAAGDGSNRFFITDRNGVVRVFDMSSSVTQATTVVDLSSKVDDSIGEGAMLGLVFDPGFASNRYFYLSYVEAASGGSPRKVRVSRFRMNAVGGSVADPASETTVLVYDHPNIDHFGGWLGFGPDGMLYISTGDAGNANLVQDTSTLFGKILRVQVGSNGGYSVPAGNPIAGNPMWAYGFRNPWRCSFDRDASTADGNLWCGDVGQASREEVNRIKKGANYGWPHYEGSLEYDNPTNRPYSDFEPPILEYPHQATGSGMSGGAVIGGFIYRGSAMPSMVGRYLFSDWTLTSLWAIQVDGSGNFVANTEVATGLEPGQIQAFGEDHNGELYAVTGFGDIFRFQETGGGGGGGPTMPATLSATGLFTDTAALTPAPFLIDYDVNAALWSDGASKRRWFVLPGSQTITFSANEAWSFPVGTITVKHFELPLAAGGTTRLETRVMVHRTDGWVGFTYRWRADQQDADLLTTGATATYQTIEPVSNTPTTLTWTFPSQAQCLNCHTAATGRVLGLNTRQFNGNHTYAATGRSDNQLRTLNHIGIFSSDIGAADQYSAMPDPKGSAGTVETRARAYLDANCSICHRPGGPTPVNMDLRYATSLADMNIVGVNAASGTARVAAGNHAQSELWQRANSSNASFRMPPLAVQMIDAEAVQLLSVWIDALQ